MKLVYGVLFIAHIATSAVMAAKIRPKVLISNPVVPRIAIDLLEKEFDVEIVKKFTKNEIIEKVKGAYALFWASHIKVDNAILDAAGPELKIVAAMSAGYDHINTTELKNRGIRLTNTPKVLNNAVADSAVLLALAASRRLYEGRILIEDGRWNPNNWVLGRDIEDSTVGIIGLGEIGKTIAKKLQAFNIEKILYTGHKEKREAHALGARFVALDELLLSSDFIFVSVPLTNETEMMCDEQFFKSMKSTAIFINTSRGKVVDQNALINALRNEEIFAAGLDVMTPEPLPTDDELLKLQNVVLLPHWGSATIKTRNAMAKLTAKNILNLLKGEKLLSPIM